MPLLCNNTSRSDLRLASTWLDTVWLHGGALSRTFSYVILGSVRIRLTPFSCFSSTLSHSSRKALLLQCYKSVLQHVQQFNVAHANRSLKHWLIDQLPCISSLFATPSRQPPREVPTRPAPDRPTPSWLRFFVFFTTTETSTFSFWSRQPVHILGGTHSPLSIRGGWINLNQHLYMIAPTAFSSGVPQS